MPLFNSVSKALNAGNNAVLNVFFKLFQVSSNVLAALAFSSEVVFCSFIARILLEFSLVSWFTNFFWPAILM